MIRPLSERDRRESWELLGRSPTYNLYMLSNLDQLGFDWEHCEFWGSFAESDAGQLTGVLNRYMAGWTLYGLPEADWEGLAAVLDRHPVTAARLQDNPGGVPSLLPFLQSYDAEQTALEELMALQHSDFSPVTASGGYEVRRATLGDLDELADFYASAGAMSRSRGAVERPLRDLRVWVAEADGRIVSAALTNAESATSAMVGGVYTADASRRKGLAQAVCSALCAELLGEGKRPVLYWQTPAAGTVYRKLGFERIGDWRSVWLRRR